MALPNGPLYRQCSTGHAGGQFGGKAGSRLSVAHYIHVLLKYMNVVGCSQQSNCHLETTLTTQPMICHEGRVWQSPAVSNMQDRA